MLSFCSVYMSFLVYYYLAKSDNKTPTYSIFSLYNSSLYELSFLIYIPYSG